MKLFIVFLCLFVTALTSISFRTLLPVYASSLGASASDIGVYMALLSLAFAIGVKVFQHLQQYMSYKYIIIFAGFWASIFYLLLLYFVGYYAVVICSILIFLFTGLGNSADHALTAWLSNDTRKGATYSIVAVSLPIAALVGSLIAGLAEDVGFSGVFAILSVIAIFGPIFAFFGLSKEDGGPIKPKQHKARPEQPLLDTSNRTSLTQLSTMVVLLYISIGGIGLSIPIIMSIQGFGIGEIAYVSAIASLISIPSIPIFGYLSDRLGRFIVLFIQMILLFIGIYILNQAGTLLQFTFVSITLFIPMYTCSPIVRAIVTDFSPNRHHYGLAISRIEFITSFAGMFGFVLFGFVLQNSSMMVFSIFHGALILLAIFIVFLLYLKRATMTA